MLLHEFVRDTITNYLENDSRDVRLAASQTCCKLFARDPIIFQTSNHSINLVTEVLEKLSVCLCMHTDLSCTLTLFLASDLFVPLLIQVSCRSTLVKGKLADLHGACFVH